MDIYVVALLSQASRTTSVIVRLVTRVSPTSLRQSFLQALRSDDYDKASVVLMRHPPLTPQLQRGLKLSLQRELSDILKQLRFRGSVEDERGQGYSSSQNGAFQCQRRFLYSV